MEMLIHRFVPDVVLENKVKQRGSRLHFTSVLT